MTMTQTAQRMQKPIIGIVGGIGAGKSFVAGLFGELGACVINADDLVHRVYKRDDVRQQLKKWWGDAVVTPSGVDRKAVAKIVFSDAEQLRRLEALVHPLVAVERDVQMRQFASDSNVTAFVWDTPLLIEAGHHTQCDVLVFCDAPLSVRLARVAARGWDEQELSRRESMQLAIDKKRALCHVTITTDDPAAAVRLMVARVFQDVLAGVYNKPLGRT